MPRQPHYDAIVVGARVSGAATAHLLARAGLDVLVVDRGQYGLDTLSTHALMRGGVMQLHRWGLLDRIVAAGTPPVRTTTFRYAHDEITVPIKASRGVDALYAPRRTLLDPVLVDAATDAGAEVRYGVTVTGVQRDSVERVVGIVGRDAAGEEVRATAPIVIGADGRGSLVAALVHAPIEHAGTAANAAVYGYWSGVEAGGYEWIFRRNACAGLIPTNDGQVCVFASAPPSQIGRGGVEQILRVLDHSSPATAERVRAGAAPPGVRTFGGHPGMLRHPWGPGWALVGDAGYWKDPISAHGITDALRDAELLANAVVAAAAGDVRQDEALAAYHQTRNRLSLRLFAITEVIATNQWDDNEIGAILIELSASMNDEVEAIAAFDEVVQR